MKVVYAKQTPKVTISAAAMSKILDYNRLSTTVMIFGLYILRDKNEYYVDDVWVPAQKAGTYYTDVDIGDMGKKIDTEEATPGGYVCCGAGYISHLASFSGILETSAIKKSIGKLYAEYIGITVYNNNDVVVSYHNATSGVTIEDIEYEIDYSVFSYGDDKIKKELSVIGSSLYSWNLYSGYNDRRYDYLDDWKTTKKLPPAQPYKDAKINKENPDLFDLV